MLRSVAAYLIGGTAQGSLSDSAVPMLIAPKEISKGLFPSFYSEPASPELN